MFDYCILRHHHDGKRLVHFKNKFSYFVFLLPYSILFYYSEQFLGLMKENQASTGSEVSIREVFNQYI